MSEEFSDIEMEIDDDLKFGLISSFVHKFDAASQSVFNEQTSNGSSLADALLETVLNEIILDAIKSQLEWEKKQNE